jgi:hypothetical protein
MDLAAATTGTTRLGPIYRGPDGAAGGWGRSDPASSGLKNRWPFLELADAWVRCTGLGANFCAVDEARTGIYYLM